MPASTRPRRLRAVAAAFAIAGASFTAAACGSDVVDDDVEQNIEEGVDEVEEGVDDATEPEN